MAARPLEDERPERVPEDEERVWPRQSSWDDETEPGRRELEQHDENAEKEQAYNECVCECVTSPKAKIKSSNATGRESSDTVPSNFFPRAFNHRKHFRQ
jgi:hypothetical protein